MSKIDVEKMSPHLRLVYDMVRNDTRYLRYYPLARQPNVFSVSRLAWDWRDLVAWKLHRLKSEWNGAMMVGKILGMKVQEEFVKADENWFTERPEVRYEIPFKWKHNPRLKNIILFGHPDLVNFKTHTLIELKTSAYSDKIHPYARFQCALYWAYLLKSTGVDFTAKVIKVSVPPREEILTRKQKIDGAQEIIRRAYLAARELDVNGFDSRVPLKSDRSIFKGQRGRSEPNA